MELQQKFREQELDNRTAMLELVTKQVELLNLQLSRAGLQAQVIQQQINNKRLVITSYSIHYTKLYDSPCRRWGHPADCAAPGCAG